MRLGAGSMRSRFFGRMSRRRTLRAAVLATSAGMSGQAALADVPTCKTVPFQETSADFLDQFLARMEISGIRNFTKSNAGTRAVRYIAPPTGFRLELEHDEGRTLTAVEGLVRHPTAQDMSIFKDAAIHSFSYFSSVPENSLGPMVEARIAALQQKKEPSTAYSGDIHLLLFPTGDGALMFRIRRIECR